MKKVYEFVNALVDLYVRVGMGAASQRIPQGAVHFVARSADKNVPHARGRVGKLPPFRPGHTDLPAHLQIRKLF